jgi:hypothetical protein
MGQTENFWKDFSVDTKYIDEIIRIYSLKRRVDAKRKLWFLNRKVIKLTDFNLFYFSSIEKCLQVIQERLQIKIELDFSEGKVDVVFDRKHYKSEFLSVALFLLIVDYVDYLPVKK